MEDCGFGGLFPGVFRKTSFQNLLNKGQGITPKLLARRTCPRRPIVGVGFVPQTTRCAEYFRLWVIFWFEQRYPFFFSRRNQRTSLSGRRRCCGGNRRNAAYVCAYELCCLRNGLISASRASIYVESTSSAGFVSRRNGFTLLSRSPKRKANSRANGKFGCLWSTKEAI